MSAEQKKVAFYSQPILRMPTHAEVMDLASPGKDGEVRFRESIGDVEKIDGEWKRGIPGWYAEVFRDGEWRKELGPFWGGLSGCPKGAVEAAIKAGLL